MCGLGNGKLASPVTYVCMFGCRCFKANFTNSDWLGNYCFLKIYFISPLTFAMSFWICTWLLVGV